MTSPATMRLVGLLVIVGMGVGCGDDPAHRPSSEEPVRTSTSSGGAIPPVWEAWIQDLLHKVGSDDEHVRFLAAGWLAHGLADTSIVDLGEGEVVPAEIARRMSAWFQANPARWRDVAPRRHFGTGSARALLSHASVDAVAEVAQSALVGRWVGRVPGAAVALTLESDGSFSTQLKLEGSKHARSPWLDRGVGRWCLWRGMAWTFITHLDGHGEMAFLDAWEPVDATLRLVDDESALRLSKE